MTMSCTCSIMLAFWKYAVPIYHLHRIVGDLLYILHDIHLLCNCSFSTFTANNVDNPTTVNEAVARAAVSSFRFPVQLAGTNMFTHNIGGGISIVDSLITIANNSHLIFEDNEANFGGGLQLVGVCLVSTEFEVPVNCDVIVLLLCYSFLVCSRPRRSGGLHEKQSTFLGWRLDGELTSSGACSQFSQSLLCYQIRRS